MSGEWADQPATPDNHGIPGKTLAAAREAMGWSVEQIADQLKMAVRQVVALEAGDYAALPGPAVVRGFVRAYAKVVKLDPVPLVAQIAIDAPEAGINGSVRQNRPTSFTQARFPSHGKRTKLPIVPIAIAVVAAAAAVGAWQLGFVPGFSATPEQPAVVNGDAALTTVPAVNGSAPAMQDPSVPLISVPPPTSESAATGASAPVTNSPVQGVTPAVPAPAAPAATAPAAAVPAAADTAPAPSANALVLTVREDSWVEVKSASGKTLIRRMVKGGETATVDIADSSTLVVGKPSAVTATLRGAEVALPLQPGKTFSRVKVQ